MLTSKSRSWSLSGPSPGRAGSLSASQTAGQKGCNFDLCLPHPHPPSQATPVPGFLLACWTSESTWSEDRACFCPHSNLASRSSTEAGNGGETPRQVQGTPGGLKPMHLPGKDGAGVQGEARLAGRRGRAGRSFFAIHTGKLSPEPEHHLLLLGHSPLTPHRTTNLRCGCGPGG